MSVTASSNRAGRRTAIKTQGAVKLGMFKSVNCGVWDISQGGARLILDEPAELPDTFKLKSDAFKGFRPCEVRWRRGLELGVKFTDALEA